MTLCARNTGRAAPGWLEVLEDWEQKQHAAFSAQVLILSPGDMAAAHCDAAEHQRWGPPKHVYLPYHLVCYLRLPSPPFRALCSWWRP